MKTDTNFEGERRTSQHIQRFSPAEMERMNAEAQRIREVEGNRCTRSRIIRRALDLYFKTTAGAIDGAVPKSARVEWLIIRGGAARPRKTEAETATAAAGEQQ